MAKSKKSAVEKAVLESIAAIQPLEDADHLKLFKDKRTGARFYECHVNASTLVRLGTTEAPLDPKRQGKYKANRQLVDQEAFAQMKSDARRGRHFSNIVAEFRTDFDKEHPIKIIGGQHRFRAIEEALAQGVDELHGLKIYMALTTHQRLDVQIISNTNIQVSKDLFDRIQETARGPALRTWCQQVGLLLEGQDFTDKSRRGGPISVQLAHSFITNFYLGAKIDSKTFSSVETTPIKCPKGKLDANWDALLQEKREMFADAGLRAAATEYASLIAAQRSAFNGRKRTPPDYPEKALSLPVMAGWAFVAGVLQGNEARLKRLYELRNSKGRDPLNVAALVQGRHHSDDDKYRGLGYRSDPREMGCFAELFFYHAEMDSGITLSAVKIAIAQYFAKKANLDAARIREREGGENAGD